MRLGYRDSAAGHGGGVSEDFPSNDARALRPSALQPGPRPSAWIASPALDPRPLVFGLTGEERLRRMLDRLGVTEVACGGPALATRFHSGAPLAVLRSDAVYDERLVQALLEQRDLALLAERTGPVVAVILDGARAREGHRCLFGPQGGLPPDLKRVEPEDLVAEYTAQLRKRQPATVCLIDPRQTRALEKSLFDASYKGVTDFVTKWLWPAPALALTRALARAGIAPNAVTALSWLLVVLASVAFMRGEHGLGLVAAWLMTFLDTVDGKLARVTVRSSRVGHVLDHGLDLVHPPIWYLAFGASLVAAGPIWVPLTIQVSVAGYLIGRLLEGVFLLAFKFEIHSWRPVDSRFRLITARRNPNLALLTAGALAGRPDLGLAAVAVWTVGSILFHAARLAMAFGARHDGRLPTSWQESVAASGPA